MKKKIIKLNEKQIDLLWGEEGPYSEVHLIKESRVLDDKVSREYYKVSMTINPTTIDILRKADFKTDHKGVAQILSMAEYRSKEYGYEAVLFNEQNTSEAVEIEAYEMYREAQGLACELHRILMEVTGLKREDI